MPETTERLSHGEPTWFVGGNKVFVTYADHHHDDRVGFWCAAPPAVQEQKVGTEPDRFFRPPLRRPPRMPGRLPRRPVDWGEIAELVEDAYRVVAPMRLAAQLDSI
jgi:hypothetical protein